MFHATARQPRDAKLSTCGAQARLPPSMPCSISTVGPAPSVVKVGICVIGAARSPAGAPIGLTANSFNSVSLEPPLVLWSLARSAGALELLSGTSHYAVNILAADQKALVTN